MANFSISALPFRSAAAKSQSAENNAKTLGGITASNSARPTKNSTFEKERARTAKREAIAAKTAAANARNDMFRTRIDRLYQAFVYNKPYMKYKVPSPRAYHQGKITAEQYAKVLQDALKGSLNRQIKNTISLMGQEERHPSFSVPRLKEIYNEDITDIKDFNLHAGEGNAVEIPGMPEIVEGGKGWELRGRGYIRSNPAEWTRYNRNA